LAEPNKRKPKPAYATGEEVELFSQWQPIVKDILNWRQLI
jgi:hypothetical protein